MLVNKLKTLEIRTRDGERYIFNKEPVLNYDVQANCFVTGSLKDKLEAFFFPVVNIICIKCNYEPVEEKPILIPTTRVNLSSSEPRQ